MYSNLEELDETTAHETRHEEQVARGEMFYDNNNQRQNYDIYKEIDAYRAQWSWDGYLNLYGLKEYENGLILPVVLKPSYYEIDPGFVNSITNKRYEPIYPPSGLDIMIWNNH